MRVVTRKVAHKFCEHANETVEDSLKIGRNIAKAFMEFAFKYKPKKFESYKQFLQEDEFRVKKEIPKQEKKESQPLFIDREPGDQRKIPIMGDPLLNNRQLTPIAPNVQNRQSNTPASSYKFTANAANHRSEAPRPNVLLPNYCELPNPQVQLTQEQQRITLTQEDEDEFWIARPSQEATAAIDPQAMVEMMDRTLQQEIEARERKKAAAAKVAATTVPKPKAAQKQVTFAASVPSKAPSPAYSVISQAPSMIGAIGAPPPLPTALVPNPKTASPAYSVSSVAPSISTLGPMPPHPNVLVPNAEEDDAMTEVNRFPSPTPKMPPVMHGANSASVASSNASFSKMSMVPVPAPSSATGSCAGGFRPPEPQQAQPTPKTMEGGSTPWVPKAAPTGFNNLQQGGAKTLPRLDCNFASMKKPQLPSATPAPPEFAKQDIATPAQPSVTYESTAPMALPSTQPPIENDSGDVPELLPASQEMLAVKQETQESWYQGTFECETYQSQIPSPAKSMNFSQPDKELPPGNVFTVSHETVSASQVERDYQKSVETCANPIEQSQTTSVSLNTKANNVIESAHAHLDARRMGKEPPTAQPVQLANAPPSTIPSQTTSVSIGTKANNLIASTHAQLQAARPSETKQNHVEAAPSEPVGALQSQATSVSIGTKANNLLAAGQAGLAAARAGVPIQQPMQLIVQSDPVPPSSVESSHAQAMPSQATTVSMNTKMNNMIQSTRAGIDAERSCFPAQNPIHNPTAFPLTIPSQTASTIINSDMSPSEVVQLATRKADKVQQMIDLQRNPINQPTIAHGTFPTRAASTVSMGSTISLSQAYAEMIPPGGIPQLSEEEVEEELYDGEFSMSDEDE